MIKLPKFLRSLGAQIIFILSCSILLTLVVGIFVQRSAMRKESHQLIYDEMSGFLIEAESVTESISTLGEKGAFDMEKLKAELHEVGAENFRETTLYQTIPVVAAWSAIEAATDHADMEFRIARRNARNPDNEPKNALEHRILQELESSDLDEIYFDDKEAGVIAYARPVVMGQSCMTCHGDPATSPTGDGKDFLGYTMEGWKAGDRQGAYILTAPMEKIDKPVQAATIASITWTLPIGLLIGGIAIFFVRSLNRNLNSIMTDLNSGSSEVTCASNDVSSSSQTLAEGASQQAASLEETSSSMEEMNSMVSRNAEVAQNTSEFATSTAKHAAEGVQSMQELRTRVDSVGNAAEEMNVAMKAIKESSDSISRIIKTIDEIAFQTNILSLNAAVEAARAGEAGAGFAVVADEVRSLAGRAADAAKETTQIIEDSISKTNHGVRANEEVTNLLSEVMDRAVVVEKGLSSIDNGVDQVNSAMGELQASVNEQSDGIEQINQALVNVNEITQSNAAAAEETASASEEMNAQALLLKGVVTRLQTIVSGVGEDEAPVRSHRLPVASTNNLSLPN